MTGPFGRRVYLRPDCIAVIGEFNRAPNHFGQSLGNGLLITGDQNVAFNEHRPATLRVSGRALVEPGERVAR